MTSSSVPVPPVPQPVPPLLADLLCFDLYATSRAITAAYRPVLAEHDLTYPQYLVLVLLGESEPSDGGPRIKDVARELRLDHATLSPLLKRLELQGLVVRARDPRDERAVTVALTPQGRLVHARFGVVHCRLGEALGIDAREIATLQRLLARINENLAAAD